MNRDREYSGIAERVEKLATDLVIGSDTERDWRAPLTELASAAEAAGGKEVASIAKQLAGSVASGDVRSTLEAGIVQLQSAIAAWERQAADPGQTVRWESEPAPLAEDPELISDFIVESREHLDSVEVKLLEIERNPDDKEAVHSVFRSFHTVKGLAGFLELGAIRDVSHEVETLLDHVRESRLAMTPRVVDVVLASLDYLNGCITTLEAGPSAARAVMADNSALLDRVRVLSECAGETAESPMEPTPAVQVQPAAPETPVPVQVEPEALQTPAVSTARAEAGKDKIQAGGKKEAATAVVRSGSRSVKIDTEKLDYLVDMVGEMVIAQSLIRYDPDLHLDRQPRLARNLSQLTRITNEVQRTAMAMRMVPIAALFQKMARLVRDLTRKCGKQAEFETFGEEVQLDRNIVEELADPLMHMIRNSVDHGIDTPAERAAKGKAPLAKIVLRAMHQAGQIVIQVLDDGRGLNRAKILAKARAQGLIEPAAEPSDAEVFNLIFHPGFSTAEQVSEVSGRGVGMDVVRKQIQKLRGSIDIQSRPGEGTTFSLKLPLTLAIIDGLVVGVGEHRYVVPIFSVKELLRPAADAIFTVENRAQMVLIREKLVPIVRLYDRFGVEPKTTDPQKAVFVLAESDTRNFCIMVDAVIGKQEIVIKSLGAMFNRVRGVAGGAILGDGHVALIIDPPALFGGGKVAGGAVA